MFRIFLLLAFSIASGQALATDQFERILVFDQNGLYPGHKLDLSVARNLIGLTDSHIVGYGFAKKAEEIDRNYYYVANFRHQNKYWVAKIPRSGVERTLLQFQRFDRESDGFTEGIVNAALSAGHVQFRFILSKGLFIELRTQDTAETRKRTRVRDFSYALNAVRALSQAGSPFDGLGDGLRNGYGLAHTFLSTEEARRIFSIGNWDVEQFLLTLTPEESTLLLDRYISLSTYAIENEIYYNTLSRSCVTATFGTFYEVVDYVPVFWFPRVWRNWRNLLTGKKTELNPRAVKELLKAQGYIKEHVKNLASDDIDCRDCGLVR